MPFLSHGSYRMRYEVKGPAEAPAYVLVNGLTQYAELWTTYCNALIDFGSGGLGSVARYAKMSATP